MSMRPRFLMPFTRAVGGGSFNSAALLAKGLIEHDIDVLALFPEEGPSTEVFRKHAVPFRIQPQLPVVAAYSRSAREALRFVGNFVGTYRAASRLLAAERFDFVHLNDGTTVLPWGLAAKRRGIATIWHIRGGNIGHTDRLRLRVSDHRICISRYVATRLPAGTRCHVLYNPAATPSGIDPVARAMTRQELGLQDEACHLIQIGRDSSYKRPSWSISAMRCLVENNVAATLTFLGDFTSERQQALLEALPVALRRNVRFPGWVSDPERYLAASDILLHPAKGEHFGRIFAEAALAGIRFIATPTGAAPELIEAGLPGVASPDDTETSFCDTVLDVAKYRNDLYTTSFTPLAWLEPAQNARMFLELLKK
jgi:glycosyltransferase involved in cell wall biosynthesis